MMQLSRLGPFTIGTVLGRGGMGTVYLGTSEADDSTVAIKVLQDTLNEDDEVRLRFEAEIDTLKRFRHPNIVQLVGFGMEEGQLYFVMEYVDGSSLHQELRKRRLFQWYEVAKIGLEMCQTLRHAHDRGVIHRDIKPANILLDQKGNVKLSDFGIARFFGSQQLTDAHTVIGTLEYMSPEQAMSLPIGVSSDLYSLGCVLYTLLTGEPPFRARTLPELLRKLQHSSPDPIRSSRTDVPDELGYIITDMLRVRLEDRPRNATLIANRLQSLLRALKGDPAEIKVFPAESPSSLPLGSLPSPSGNSLPDSICFVDKCFSEANQVESDNNGGDNDDDRVAPEPIHQEKDDLLASELPTVVMPSREVPGTSIKESSWVSGITKTSNVQQDDKAKTYVLAALMENSDAGQESASFQLGSIPIKLPHESSSSRQQDNAEKQSGKKAASRDLNEETADFSDKTIRSHSHFTAVTKTDINLFEEEGRETKPIVSLTTILTSTMLLIIGLTIYYLIQPTPPDVLFKRITATLKKGDSEEGFSFAALLSVQNDIEEYLSSYPNHTNADQIRIYQDELELSEHERRLERRMQFSTLRMLSPVERTYVNILTSSPGDYERMIDQLRAFIDVFQITPLTADEGGTSPRSASNPAVICVELARRRLKKLEQDAEEINVEQKEIIRRRMDEAENWDLRNPAHARNIRLGIIELYQDQRWAKDFVEEARLLLEDNQ